MPIIIVKSDSDFIVMNELSHNISNREEKERERERERERWREREREEEEGWGEIYIYIYTKDKFDKVKFVSSVPSCHRSHWLYDRPRSLGSGVRSSTLLDKCRVSPECSRCKHCHCKQRAWLDAVVNAPQVGLTPLSKEYI